MITEYRLCNVLLTDGTRTDEYPGLYYHQHARAKTNDDGSLALADPTLVTYDFATYFNAFSNRKWRRYTIVDNVHLRVVARGSFTVRLTAYEDTKVKPRRVILGSKSFSFGDGYGVADLAYPESDAVLLSFELLGDDTCAMKEAYYYTLVEEERIRPVELAVAMTTIGKESFVIANLKLFKEEVLGCDEPVARHFTVHVVDNGRTLDAKALGSDRVTIHPNPNVGGAGGFTRGMIEALEQDPKPTHVLLMDDDVQISPESYKRTYNLLSLVRDEYAEALISGAMLSMERQDEFYEDMGYVMPNGDIHQVKEPRSPIDRYCIANLEDVVHLEMIENHNANCYAAWWYCCIPIPLIERNGLPLPIFIRWDDVEYGNRVGRKFITMNGLCVWHMTFVAKFRAALDRYMSIRNGLIDQATTGVFAEANLLENFYVNFSTCLKTFNYNTAELCVMAIEDFLKGPEFLKHVNSDRLFKRVMSMNENPVPIEQIDDPRVQAADFNPALLYRPQGRNLAMRAYDFLTYNGQRGPERLNKGGLGIVPYNEGYYPPNDIRGKDALLAVTADGSEAILRKKDRARFDALSKRYKAAMKDLAERGDEVRAQWAAARDELTSMDFWKWYLDDQLRQAE